MLSPIPRPELQTSLEQHLLPDTSTVSLAHSQTGEPLQPSSTPEARATAVEPAVSSDAPTAPACTKDEFEAPASTAPVLNDETPAEGGGNAVASSVTARLEKFAEFLLLAAQRAANGTDSSDSPALA